MNEQNQSTSASMTGLWPVLEMRNPEQPRRTKIVATLGPASDSPLSVMRLAEAGMDVGRLNFSHGTHSEHLARLHAVREAEQRVGRPLAVMADLCGPKIRVRPLAEPKTVVAGDVLGLAASGGDPRDLSITYDGLADAAQVGDRLLIDDGRIRTRVVERTADGVLCLVETGGIITSGKGVNLPDTTLPIPCLTPKDLDDLAFAIEHGVEYVALSFVRSASDIQDLRGHLATAGSSARIVAKIEKAEAIADLEAIVDATDVVMVARGDLGVEIGVTEVPLLQKRIIDVSRGKGRTVITATQMLESMITESGPTRAEVSDVANAILDGTSAVMLSAETASGAYPVAAVATMAEIACKVEQAAQTRFERVTAAGVATVLMHAACEIADEVGAAAIAVPTASGTVPRDLSRFRPHQPIIAACPSPTVVRQLALDWGVVPVQVQPSQSVEETWAAATAAGRAAGLVTDGDLVVLAGRRPFGDGTETSHIALHRLPENGGTT